MTSRPAGPEQSTTLVVTRTIRASAARLFEAWTRPELLTQWWGPRSVVCPQAEVDLRVGGRYRIANRFPDATVLWISGEFEAIEAPRRLVYSWRVGDSGPSERVTVLFREIDAGSTEVVVTHERIPSAALRDRHQQGWVGCLDGLERWAGEVSGKE